MVDLRENKGLKILLRIIKAIIYIFLICIIFIIIIQRVSNNSIAVCGIRIFNVISESMYPDYEKGDLLLVKQTDIDKIEIGQDLAYQGESGDLAGRIVTHRVIGIDETENGKIFHTKGLVNPIEDPEVKENQIFGVVKYKFVVLSLINKLLYNPYIFYSVLIVPIGIIIFLEIKNIRERLDEEE